MGNACDSYCAYEEQNQLLFGQKTETILYGEQKLTYTPDKRISKKTVVNKQMRSQEEKNTYWLRGMGPQKFSSPIRANLRPSSNKREPVIEEEQPPQINIIQVKPEVITEKPIIVEETIKKKRIRKKRNGKFPFEYIHNVETDQINPEQYVFTQRLNVNGDKMRYISPQRDKPLSHEEKIACILNNKVNDMTLKTPQLANEIIITEKNPIEQPKRLKFKDAGVQIDEKKTKKHDKSTDISTATEITPQKYQKEPEQPIIPIIEEQPKKKITKRKQPAKKKQVQVVQEEHHQVHEIVIDPDEEILMESEMKKFKPGIEKNFIPRWIQLSTRSFRYYKNHYHSICYLTRPISAIPLVAIEKVQNFQIQNQDYKKREKELYSFMFEIVLKRDYEDIYFFREFEVNGVTNNSPPVLDIRYESPGRRSSDHSRSRRSLSPQKFSFHKSSDNGQIIVTNQDENGQIVQTKMLFISPPKRDTREGSPQRNSSVSAVNPNHEKVTRIVQGHLMPIRDLNKGTQRDHYLEDQKIIYKEFGEPQVNIHGEQSTYTWSNRQNEWYNSERRFIFSCKNEQERKKWMQAIRIAVKNNNERLRQEEEERLKQEADLQMQWNRAQKEINHRDSGYSQPHSFYIGGSRKDIDKLV